MSYRRSSPGKPTVTPRKGSMSQRQSEDFDYECKAAYLVVFDDLDDEIRSKDQLNRVLQQAGRNPSRKTLLNYWKGKDLTFHDFCNICAKEPATSEDELMKAFKKIDLNGDGYLSNYELRKVLTEKGERMSEAEVAVIIEEVDENKDGRLDYKEFCTYVMKTQEEAKQFALKNMKRKGHGRKSNTFDNKNKEDTHSIESRSQRSKHQDSDYDSDNRSISSEKNSYLNESTRSRHSTREDLEDHQLFGQSSPKLSARSKTSSHKVQLSARSHGEKESEGSRGLLSKYKDVIQEEDYDVEEDMSQSDGESIDEDMTGSQVSLKRKSAYPPKPQPRRRSGAGDYPQRDLNKAAVTSKEHRLPKPRNLKEWKKKASTGCFFFEDDGRVVSHQYTIDVAEDTSVWITVEPMRDSHGSPIDTMAFLLRDDDSLVTFTEHRDNRGKYGVRCDLESGVYKLIPFTTGCRFKRRQRESEVETKLVKKKDDSYLLTTAFKEALSQIFEMCDLDGDGLMSREEFNWFNVRTSGEEVNDEEWSVVEDTVSLQKGKLTKEGFTQLNQMEAEDNQGDTDDLWVTLNSMGFNKELKVDEACQFSVEVYAEDSSVKLKVVDLKSGGRKLETAIVESTMGKGESMRVKHTKDLLLHTYSNDFRSCVVVENKASSKVTLDLDCSRSKNTVSNRKSLDYKLDVPPKSVMVGLHLMPKKESQDWSVVVNESIVT